MQVSESMGNHDSKIVDAARLKKRLRCGRRRFVISRSGYVRCSIKIVLRRMRACFWKVCSEMSNAKPVGCARRQLAILAVCTENLIRVDDVKKSPKLAE
jgi:hypothetical protein